jgi:uncharacterized membrane protein
MAMAAGIAGTVCGVVLLIAGAMKIGGMGVFGQQIAAYSVLPRRLARLAGYLLPPLEMTVGISMLFAPRLGAVAAFLFACFAMAVGLNLLRGRTELRCGCFGATGRHTISWGHVAGNFTLALLAVLSFFGNHRPSFLAFQVGVSLALLVLLLSAWQAMTPKHVQLDR